jgi:hypothetical protein
MSDTNNPNARELPSLSNDPLEAVATTTTTLTGAFTNEEALLPDDPSRLHATADTSTVPPNATLALDGDVLGDLPLEAIPTATPPLLGSLASSADASRTAEPTEDNDATSTINNSNEVADISPTKSQLTNKKRLANGAFRYTYNKKSRNARPWNDMLYELCLYRAKHGDVKVDKAANEELYNWCVVQRRTYQYLKHPKSKPDNLEKNPNRLTPQREAILSSLDFEWTILNHDNENRWDKRFQQLVDYKAQHGHCNVPQSCPLGKWVKMQREQKAEADLEQTGQRVMRGKPRPMIPPAREAKLTELGLQWRLAKVVGWEKRYDQLLEYKAIHGHPHVPQSYPPDKCFGRWVMKQRSEYSLKRRGKKSQLTEERIASLEEIGFAWVAPHIQKIRESPNSPSKKRGREDDEEGSEAMSQQHMHEGEEDEEDVQQSDGANPNASAFPQPFYATAGHAFQHDGAYQAL